ncbi:MAG: NAD-dependent epimerase/dehydratase family protein [Phycisphaerales bacterium]|nr:NAD-dependent epimerase/dehydratase family protein [Phycisphaerales bacterium]
MTQSRREFLSTAAAGAAGVMLSPYAAYGALGRSQAPLRILILGGTGFLGPHCVEACRARGHALTLFNRGRTENVTGHKFEGEDGIEIRHGNRDPLKLAADDQPEGPDNPKGLASLAEGEWDGVIDTSGYWPRIVGASAELLAPRVQQYLFISTVSVYASNEEVGADVTAPLGTMADPTVEEFGQQFENYGPAKVLCEQACEKALPGRVTVLRPGLIVGPGDTTGRFTSWPVRVAKGGEVLAPGTPSDPIQLIDVRDLAAWVVHCLEQKVMGTYDAVGPLDGELNMGGVLEGCKTAAASDATFTWADADFLDAHGVSAWGDMPLWVPPRGDSAGFHRRNVKRSYEAGMKLRSVDETAKATLDWYNELPADSRFKRLAGIDAEREAEVLKAWHEANG